jgi:Uncharacterized conserved protein, contains double-stranded beta-helix domain
MILRNIFSDIPEPIPDEIFEHLVERKEVTIERIISKGHSSPDGFWHDQNKDEFVILLKGRAILRFAEHDETLKLRPGDYINIPAHVKHRVEWTPPDQKTIWLAIYYR